MTQDTLAADDEAGRTHGFLVYSDAAPLDVLAEVVAELLCSHPHPMSALTRLPTRLREQVRQRLLSAT
ncbi:hypothetical protein [Kineococcus sp. NPDC059986]|uniref:hypothetical protein n=1 Tax=Kineococcus sp. NPDC059986 TaxID=3155538 RepID=UPI003450209C